MKKLFDPSVQMALMQGQVPDDAKQLLTGKTPVKPKKVTYGRVRQDSPYGNTSVRPGRKKTGF